MIYQTTNNDPNEEGIWVETAYPDEPTAFDPDTMPHALVKAADGDFYFKAIDGTTVGGSTMDTWVGRLSGDNESNPGPAFVGEHITSLSMIQNRLVIVTRDHVNLSKPRAEFTYWANSAIDVIDTDPIDLTTPGTDRAGLFATIEHDQYLAVLGQKRQFAIKLTASLTNKNAALIPTTTYELMSSCAPAVIGSSVYLAYEQSGYAGVREYKESAVFNNAMVADAVTAHIPHYIPSTLSMLVADTQNSVLLGLADDNTTMYVYQTLTKGADVVMEGWHSIDTGFGIPISATCIRGKYYILMKVGSTLHLCTMEERANTIIKGDLPFIAANTAGVITTTGWVGESTARTLDTISAVLGSGTYAGMEVQVESIGATTVTLREKVVFDGEDVILTVPYNSQYQPTLPVLRDNTGKAKLMDNLIIGDLDVSVYQSGHFTVDIASPFYDTTTQSFTGLHAGTTFIPGEVVENSRRELVNVWMDAREGEVLFKCNTPNDLVIQAIEYMANFTQRGGRY